MYMKSRVYDAFAKCKRGGLLPQHQRVSFGCSSGCHLERFNPRLDRISELDFAEQDLPQGLFGAYLLALVTLVEWQTLLESKLHLIPVLSLKISVSPALERAEFVRVSSSLGDVGNRRRGSARQD